MTKTTFNLKLFFLFLFIAFFNSNIYSQCAGDDNALTICNKETYNQGIGNPNGVINLYTLLGGAPTPGGTWTNINSAGGFTALTGILNTWQINKGGVYNFRYTVTGVSGCIDNVSIITITLGGFPGVDNLTANACINFTSVPLFSFLGSGPNPDNNGSWSGGPVGSISGNFFNPQLAGVGTYTLVYTTSAIGTCVAKSSTVKITVHPLAIAGIATPLRFCETDDFSTFTNLDLFDQLSGEDGGGSWTDASGTGEISGAGDSIINIQNIAATLGPGTYTFTYTVDASNPICISSTADVVITIEPVVDLNGSSVAVAPTPICFSEIATTPLITKITQGVTPIPDGSYNVTYVLTGANSGSETVPVTFLAGVATFTVNPAFLTSIGTTTLEITTVIDPNTVGNCTRTISNLTTSFLINENPNISDSQLIISNICLGENAQGQISDINAPIIQLTNGTYTITYNITGPSGTITGQTASVTITGGSGNFPISSALIPIDGNYSVTITNVSSATNCSTTANIIANFIVAPIPDAKSIVVTIADICDGDNVVVAISGGTNLANGNYDIIYDITGAINVTGQTALNVNFVSGNGSFTLPTGILSIGVSTLTIKNLTNSTSTCETTTFTNPADTFEIHAIPNADEINITVNDNCLSQVITVNVFDTNPGVAPELTNGSYSLTYSLSGANVASGQTATVLINSGNGSFVIPNSLLTNTGTTTITLTLVKNDTTGCSVPALSIADSFYLNPIPNINTSEISIPNICLGSNGSVTINSLGGLINGNYQLNYTVSGANGPSTQNVLFSVTAGLGTFNIPSALLTNIGLTTVTFNIITNLDTTCSKTLINISKDFNVNPIPKINTNEMTVADVCLGSNGVGTIANALNLANGTYTITYNLSGANTASNQTTTTTIVVVSGTGSGTFSIPSGLLTTAGSTTITITGVSNNSTTCGTTGLSISDAFMVFALPNITGATISVADVCINTKPIVTISNATALLDGNYTITYNLSGANTSTGNAVTIAFVGGASSFEIPILLLPNGGSTTITFQSFTLGAALCGASTFALSPVTFKVSDPQTPTLNTGGNLFCIQDSPKVSNLTANVTATGTVIWYNASTGGTAYNNNDILIDGNTYYGIVRDTNGCESSVRLDVLVDLTACGNLFIPDGFSPNGDGLNEEFYIKNIEDLYPNFSLEIYNRYGSIVYKGDINSSRFDGKSNQFTINGKEILPTGVYFYILNFNDSNNTKPKQGRLYLSR